MLYAAAGMPNEENVSLGWSSGYIAVGNEDGTVFVCVDEISSKGPIRARVL